MESIDNILDNSLKSLKEVIFGFSEHILSISWNRDTDEVDINLTSSLQYPLGSVFKIENQHYFMTDMTHMKFWKRFLHHSCDWAWILINSSACVDAIQLSFNNMNKNIQILALNELKIFELKKFQ